jgi:hypothetical protein
MTVSPSSSVTPGANVDPLERVVGSSSPSSMNAALVQYDYLKHLSTIALVAIGAIVTYLQSATDLRGHLIMISLSFVAISAAICFGSMNHLISRLSSDRLPRRWLHIERIGATLLFAAGLALFASEVGRVLT